MVEKKTKFCSNCGKKIDAKAEVCPKCGVRVRRSKTRQAAEIKNPALAAVLSFLITGVGQMYNGQVAKGLAMLVFAIILGLTIIGLIGTVIIWIYGIVDAYETAKKINAGEMKT